MSFLLFEMLLPNSKTDIIKQMTMGPYCRLASSHLPCQEPCRSNISNWDIQVSNFPSPTINYKRIKNEFTSIVVYNTKRKRVKILGTFSLPIKINTKIHMKNKTSIYSVLTKDWQKYILHVTGYLIISIFLWLLWIN